MNKKRILEIIADEYEIGSDAETGYDPDALIFKERLIKRFMMEK